ncbi:HutD family protein [Yinghuangia aomiensis]
MDATLLGGVNRDLNIMTRRARWAASVHTTSAPVVPTPGHAELLYVLRGRWECGRALEPGQGAWWTRRGRHVRTDPTDRRRASRSGRTSTRSEPAPLTVLGSDVLQQQQCSAPGCGADTAGVRKSGGIAAAVARARPTG